MTDLERLALLGDQKAQEECTRQEILLRCPFCGGAAQIIRFRDYGWKQFKVSCDRCFMSFGKNFYDEKKAIEQWNTRPAPPIGCCKDCAEKEKATVNQKVFLICPASGMDITDYDFCSWFKQRE